MSIQSEIDRINGNVATTYSALEDLGATMPAQQTTDNLAETVKSVSAVLYIEQSLTDEQKAQARKNIGVDFSVSPVTTAGDGSAYTATIAGITELYVGLKITIIPHVVSASTTPTLNLNGLGAIRIAMLTTANYTAVATPSLASWLSKGKPIELTYNGTYWIADMRRPSAAYLYGQVPVTGGGTGADNAEDARKNLGITSLLPEVTAEDNGKFLRVVDGKWAAVSFPYSEVANEYGGTTVTIGD